MRQKNSPDKSAVITALIASVCIIVYLAALVFAAVRIYVSIDERRLLAEREFFDIADLASSAGVMGFMDEPFVQAIEDALASSRTLEGLIISGPEGEYAFERNQGSAITLVNNSPRFKSRFDLSRDLYMPLRIGGQRNVNIQAAAGILDYGLTNSILRQTLLAILAALVLAFFTLLLESLALRKPAPAFRAERFRPGGPAVKPAEEPSEEPSEEPAVKPLVNPAAARYGEAAGKTPPPVPGGKDPAGPQGLYSPSGIGWEDYTEDRLASELHRCASSEQDLVFIVMEFKAKLPGGFYGKFAEDAVRFFTLRDLIFDRGERGISIIFPNIDLEQGFSRSEEFHKRIFNKYPGFFRARTDLCIGISSRSGRLVDAERIMFEAAEALDRALADPASHIVAFKSDPEKYRAFIRREGQEGL
jgi:hypothetical protein